MISAMVFAEIWYVLTCSLVVLIFKLSMSLSTLTSLKTPKPTSTELVVLVDSGILDLLSTSSTGMIVSTCIILNVILVLRFNPSHNRLTNLCTFTTLPKTSPGQYPIIKPTAYHQKEISNNSHDNNPVASVDLAKIITTAALEAKVKDKVPRDNHEVKGKAKVSVVVMEDLQNNLNEAVHKEVQANDKMATRVREEAVDKKLLLSSLLTGCGGGGWVLIM